MSAHAEKTAGAPVVEANAPTEARTETHRHLQSSAKGTERRSPRMVLIQTHVRVSAMKTPMEMMPLSCKSGIAVAETFIRVNTTNTFEHAHAAAQAMKVR